MARVTVGERRGFVLRAATDTPTHTCFMTIALHVHLYIVLIVVLPHLLRAYFLRLYIYKVVLAGILLYITTVFYAALVLRACVCKARIHDYCTPHIHVEMRRSPRTPAARYARARSLQSARETHRTTPAHTATTRLPGERDGVLDRRPGPRAGRETLGS